jgi:hypothetical protein
MEVVGKEIVQWLPVTIGKQFPSVIAKHTYKYKHGGFKAREDLPVLAAGGLVSVLIQMPLTNIQEYLSSILDIETLTSDETLIDKL